MDSSGFRLGGLSSSASVTLVKGVVQTAHRLGIDGLEQAQAARFLREEQAADVPNWPARGSELARRFRRGSMGGG
jgi:hypothetical protein